MSTSSSTSILSVGTNSQGLPTLGNTVSGGIDVNSAVNTALAAAEIPMQLLQQQQSKLQSQDSSLSQVSTDLSSLLTSVQALGDPWGALNSMTTTSSDTSVVTASAAAGSQAGNHTVVVGNLATKSSYYSSELASGSTTFTAGTITLKVGSGSAVTIPASGTANTLTSLAQDINNANAGITATVVTDAGGSRLAMVANSSGAASDISVTGNTTGLTMTKAVAGVDASLTVDGVPVDSASNTVTTIPGITLNLQSAAPSETISVGVSADTSAASSAVQGFVSAYNTVINEINAQAATSSSGASSSAVLAGDSTIRDIQQRILTDVTTSLTGNGGINNLETLGVQMNNDGTLTVNTATLNNALNTNFSAVQNFFQNASGLAPTFSSDLYNLTDPTQGEVALVVKGNNATISALQNSINDDQVNLTSQQSMLESEYNAINTTLEELPTLQAQTSAQLQNI